MNPTIYDVAEKAGVSISTVSLALNKPDRVGASTLQKVLTVVADLGYVPKTEAVVRAQKGVGRIGLIAPFTSSITAGRRLNGVLSGLRSSQLELVVFDHVSAARSRLQSLPLAQRVDGLIVIAIPITDEVEGRINEQALPTVLIDVFDGGFSSVIVDHFGGGVAVAEHLRDKGHDRMAFIGHQQSHDYASQSQQQLAGFASMLPAEPDVLYVQDGFDNAMRVATELLSRDDRPTAVFAHQDTFASAVLLAARRLSLRVPAEVAVVGFDDSEIAEPLGLTSVHQPFEESGEIAVQMLLDRLARPDSSERYTTVGVRLVERETT